MSRDLINEASAFTLMARFARANVATVPSTVRYRIKDVTNDRLVTDWTDVTPASAVTIEVTAEENEIYQDSSRPFRRREERVISVQANYDTDSQYTEEIRYLIRNLHGFDS
jgi:hypothetical protein